MAWAGRFAAWRIWLRGGATASQLGGWSPWRIGAVQAERAIVRLVQKLCPDQRSDQRAAGFAVEAPQALGLRERQAKSRHVQVFPCDPPQRIFDGNVEVGQRHGSTPRLREYLRRPCWHAATEQWVCRPRPVVLSSAFSRKSEVSIRRLAA